MGGVGRGRERQHRHRRNLQLRSGGPRRCRVCAASGNRHPGFVISTLKTKAVQSREMENIEHSSNDTFYPFQNKHQSHQHLWSVKILCRYEKIKHGQSNAMG